MLTDQELATVLAALRFWANALDEQGEEFAFTFPHFVDHLPLTPGQIESLCDRLNYDEPGLLDTPVVTMCRRVADTAENWADCSDLRELAAILRELGSDCRELLKSLSDDRASPRFVLYDFDADELVTTSIYGRYSAAKADADELNNVLILPLFGTGKDNTQSVIELDAGESCECEQPGHFYCGIPGILAHLDNGRLAPGCQAQRCDQCQRYPSDEAALTKLKELGLT